MKTVEISVNDGFLMPDLSEISADEWEVGIQTVVDFHSISRSNSSSNDQNETIQTAHSSKFAAKYDKLKQKLEMALSDNNTYQHELESLTDRYNTSRREFVNELETEKKKIEENIKGGYLFKHDFKNCSSLAKYNICDWYRSLSNIFFAKFDNSPGVCLP